MPFLSQIINDLNDRPKLYKKFVRLMAWMILISTGIFIITLKIKGYDIVIVSRYLTSTIYDIDNKDFAFPAEWGSVIVISFIILKFLKV